MTVVGTRPEIIRLSRTIALLDEVTDHLLVHTGQNYDFELNEIFFKDLAIRQPDRYLDAAGDTAVQTIGRVLCRVDEVLRELQPEALLVLGDTNSSFAAIAAKRLRIPVFHMEAGNRCFDFRVPEEINRRIVDHVSDVNLPYSAIAREYLLREGLPPDRIIKTGSPMLEVLEYYRDRIDASRALASLDLKQESYFLVSAHREETVDSPVQFEKLLSLLNLLATEHERRVIVSTHPRTRKRLEETATKMHSRVEFVRPLSFTDYVKLQQNALAVLSDSGTITEEASILNLPALNIREAHERPEGMEEAAAILTGLDSRTVMQALSLVLTQPRGRDRAFEVVADYSTRNVSSKVVRIIVGYTGYVRRTVWHEA